MPKKPLIYLDYAAATPLNPKVERLISHIQREFWANPSSVHTPGKKARQVLEDSRKRVAAVLGTKKEEIVFTGSGSEANNLAILGVARAYKNKGRHLITSAIEHLSVWRAFRQLEKEGFVISYLPVNKQGLLKAEQVKKVLRPETVLVSVAQANNEIGTIQLVREIAEVVKEWRRKRAANFPYLHSDSCQAAGYLNVQPQALGVDLLTLNGSKIYGPKGVGILYKRSAVEIDPMVHGGSQERGLRAGTENIALAAGMALALEMAEREKKKEATRLLTLRGWFIKEALKSISGSRLNGDSKKRLPNNINLSFKDVDGEQLLFALNQQGVAVSTGSACTTSETGQSHVMKAIKNPSGWGNLRITLGRETKESDLKKVLQHLKESVEKQRLVHKRGL